MEGELVVGSWINSCSPIIAELMASAEFDFLCVDAEHSAVDLSQVQQLFQAIKAGNPDCAPVIRLPGVDYAYTKRYLDAGAQGVIAPLVMNRSDAEQLIEATKYPPTGNRGLGFCRANQYGKNVRSYFKQANEDIFVAVQIEHINAVEAIDEILDVSGIDAVFIGPFDLSASMGLAGEFDNPRYLEASSTVLEACKNKGIAPGIHVVQPDAEQFLEQANEGYQLMAFSLDTTIISEACRTGLEKIKSRLKS